jgi:nitrate reductase gamma subunit
MTVLVGCLVIPAILAPSLAFLAFAWRRITRDKAKSLSTRRLALRLVWLSIATFLGAFLLIFSIKNAHVGSYSGGLVTGGILLCYGIYLMLGVASLTALCSLVVFVWATAKKSQ